MMVVIVVVVINNDGDFEDHTLPVTMWYSITINNFFNSNLIRNI
jgi:hypothetical protein